MDNGDEIEVRFDEGYQRLVIYDSWVLRGLARHAEGMGRLRAVYSSLLDAAVAGGAPEEEAPRRDGEPSSPPRPASRPQPKKELVEAKLRMLANYEALLGAKELTDVHRYALGELYLGRFGGPSRCASVVTDSHGTPPEGGSDGLVLKTPENLAWWYQVTRTSPSPSSSDPKWFNPLMKAFLEGVSGRDLDPDAHAAGSPSWTTDAERYFVRETLRRTGGDRENEHGCILGIFNS